MTFFYFTLNLILLLTTLSFTISNTFLHYRMVREIELLENKYQMLKTLVVDNTLSTDSNYNDFYLYGSLGILFVLLLVYMQNENFLFNQKVDLYQNDVITILSDVLKNAYSIEQTEYILSQFHRILLNQQTIIEIIEKNKIDSFVVDPSTSELVAHLSNVFNM